VSSVLELSFLSSGDPAENACLHGYPMVLHTAHSAHTRIYLIMLFLCSIQYDQDTFLTCGAVDPELFVPKSLLHVETCF
jgi:hypothetical protein